MKVVRKRRRIRRRNSLKFQNFNPKPVGCVNVQTVQVAEQIQLLREMKRTDSLAAAAGLHQIGSELEAGKARLVRVPPGEQCCWCCREGVWIHAEH